MWDLLFNHPEITCSGVLPCMVQSILIVGLSLFSVWITSLPIAFLIHRLFGQKKKE
jgi:hypothetical protein